MKLGIDLSFWDGKCNYELMKENQIAFAFVKLCQGTRHDVLFDTHWDGLKAVGIVRGAYLFLDWTVPVEKQVDYFIQQLLHDKGELPPVVDFEMRKNHPGKDEGLRWLRYTVTKLRDVFGQCIIYTSPGYWHEFGTTDSEWQSCPLWIAHYGVKAPFTPKPWTTWAFWQYTDRGLGVQYGAEARDVDLNYFNDDALEWDKFLQSPIVPAVPEPSFVPQPIRAKALRKLNVRQNPSINAPVLYTRNVGEEFTIFDMQVNSGTEVWVKSSDGWSVLTWHGIKFVEVIHDQEESKD